MTEPSTIDGIAALRLRLVAELISASAKAARSPTTQALETLVRSHQVIVALDAAVTEDGELDKTAKRIARPPSRKFDA